MTDRMEERIFRGKALSRNREKKWQKMVKGKEALLVGGLVAIFIFPIYWVSNHPN